MARIDDGYQTLIDIAGVNFWEKSVTPPGIDGGGEIDTTVMANATYRTKSPKALFTLAAGSFTAAYDPAAYNTILAQINVNQLITITFPDGSTLAFWGWLNTFTPGELVEGEQPTAEIELIPSNQNAAGAETAPVYTAAP